MSKVGDYFRELEERGLYESNPQEIILCDGDCENYYKEEDMNIAFEGDSSHNYCDKCMFFFLGKQKDE